MAELTPKWIRGTPSSPIRVNTWVALLATTGVVLSAAYALWLYRRVIFGVLSKESLKGLLDLSTREKAVIYPLVVLVIFFGVYPAPIFDATAASVQALVNNVTVSLDAVPQPQPALVQPAAAAPAAAH
jgi:NADH-quinone oxidoreductase subunit M